MYVYTYVCMYVSMYVYTYVSVCFEILCVSVPLLVEFICSLWLLLELNVSRAYYRSLSRAY
jgi:hypothetical protein